MIDVAPPVKMGAWLIVLTDWYQSVSVHVLLLLLLLLLLLHTPQNRCKRKEKGETKMNI